MRPRSIPPGSRIAGITPAGSGGPAANVYFMTMYYDAADRETDSVNVGTNGNSVYTRPGTVPARSDTTLVTTTAYAPDGMPTVVTDPRGIASETLYDLLGRTTETIAAWDGTSSPTPTTSTNQTTLYAYDGEGNQTSMTAVQPSGTPSQTTDWVYGVAGGASGIFSNDLLAKVEYPDATTGSASTAASDDVTYAYDALGEKSSMTDQNGTTHAYSYDLLGRQTLDSVTTLGSGVDGSVRAIGTSFNTQGLPFQETSYSDAAATTVVNQTQDVYNGLGQLATEYQSHGPATPVLSDADVNSPAHAGSASVTSGTWTVNGGGADVYGTSDQFNFDSQTLAGDGTLIARVASLTNTNAYAKAGLMIRGSSAANAPEAAIVVTAAGGLDFQYRTTTGGSTTQATVGGIAAPEWVKLVRTGNSFSGYYSSDGVSWTQLGTTQTISAIPSSALAGLAVTAHDNTKLATATFDHVTLSTPITSAPSVQYAYSDPSLGSRQTSMTYPNGRVLNDVYNSGIDTTIGRVSALADAGGSAAGTDQSYTYQGMDAIVGSTDGNGVVETTTLDPFGRTGEIKYVNASTTTTDDFGYGYDRDGNVLYENNLLDSSESELYHGNSTTSGDDNTAYDPLNRLTGFERGTLSSSGNNGSALDTVSSPVASQNWNLNAVGDQSSVTTNGTTTTNSTNAKNELTTNGSNSLTFDNNGNETTDENGHTTTYDAWNRAITVKNAAGTTIASYSYDPQNRRVTEATGGTTADVYFTNQWQDIEERQGGTATRQNVWGLGYVNQLVERDDNSSSGNLGTSGSGLGERLYAQQDANWNVTGLVDSTGDVAERMVYSPYGSIAFLTASWTPTTDAYAQKVLFQGGRFEASTGLYIFENRDYDPATGAWTEADPVGYFAGNDTYQSFGANPVRYVDSSGCDSQLNDVLQLRALAADWSAKGFSFAAALLTAFIDQHHVRYDGTLPDAGDEFEKFAGEIKGRSEYRDAASEYFGGLAAFYLNSKGPGVYKGLSHSAEPGREAYTVNFIGIAGLGGDVGAALGNAHFGYKDLTLEVDAGGCWTVDGTMIQTDVFSWPAGIFGWRLLSDDYSAGNELQDTYHFQDFKHTETWNDSISGDLP